MRFIPFLILIYVWLIAGRADPGDIFQYVPIIRWLTYAFIPVLLFLGFMYIVIQRRYIKTVIDKTVVVLILIIAFSTYLNEAPLIDLFYGVGVYLRYPLLFILFCNIPETTTKGKVFLYTYGCVITLLVLEAILSAVLFGNQQDQTFFTLGVSWGTANAGVFFSVSISLIFAHVFLRGIRSFSFLLFILILVATWIASIRVILLVIVVSFFIIFAIHKRRFTSRGLIGICIVFNLAIFLAVSVDWHAIFSLSPFLSTFDPGYRFDYIREVLFSIQESKGSFFIGAGPRSMRPGTLDSAGGLYSFLLYNVHNAVRLGSNQYVKGIAELGAAGIILYWYMLCRILRVAWSNWILIRDSSITPLWLQVVNLAFFGVWSFYAYLGLLSNDLWRMDASSFLFWFFASIIANAYRREQSKGFYYAPNKR